MQTLDLECPSCGESLELDAGFAGGVCRCSNCGTLMTVPRDAGRAERLSAPPSAGEMSDGTIDPADLQFASGPSSPSRERAQSKRDKRDKGKKGKRAGAGSTTIEAGEYRTASGKVVHVDAPIRVPMAQSKRKKIRLITTVVFMTVVLGIAIAASIGLWMMFQSGKGGASGTGGADNTSTPQYDSSANPFALKFANVAGLPLTGKVAIVTEASTGDSEYWMPDAKDLLTTGLGAGNSTAQVTLFAATNKKPVAFGSGSPTLVTEIKPADLIKWFDGLTFTPKVNRTEAIKLALADKPDTLILVFAGGTDAEVKQWRDLIGSDKSPIVHAVLINSSSPLSIQQWLLDREGSEIISISAQEIQSWKQVAE